MVARVKVVTRLDMLVRPKGGGDAKGGGETEVGGETQVGGQAMGRG